MTRKATLIAWAEQLGAPVPADPTVAQLEQAIEQAIAPDPLPSFREGLANNARVLREELPGAVRAVVANLRG